MTPILQIMIGMGIGIIGALFLTPLAIGYAQSHANNNRRTKKTYNFCAEPGQRCSICLDNMNDPRDMQYLNCGHALHDSCYRQVIAHDKKCPECRCDI